MDVDAYNQERNNILQIVDNINLSAKESSKRRKRLEELTITTTHQNTMQAIPKKGIMKVSTQSESLAATSLSSRRSIISRSQSRRNNSLKRDASTKKSSSNIILRRLSTRSLGSQSPAAKNKHHKVAPQTINDAKQKRVRFNTISIREYEIQPSDNPSTMFYPGLELGWKYNVLVSSFSIDKFESQRTTQRREQYNQRPLLTTYRRSLLLEFGFSQKDIEVASARARALKEEREKSIERMHLDWCDRIMEDFRVCCSRVLKLSCKRSVVADGVDVMKGENDTVDTVDTVLHPSVLVDTSAETGSFFDASLKEDLPHQMIVHDDNNDATRKGEEAPVDD